MDDRKKFTMVLLSLQILNGCRSPCFLQIRLRSERYRLLPRIHNLYRYHLLPWHSCAKRNQHFFILTSSEYLKKLCQFLFLYRCWYYNCFHVIFFILFSFIVSLDDDYDGSQNFCHLISSVFCHKNATRVLFACRLPYHHRTYNIHPTSE